MRRTLLLAGAALLSVATAAEARPPTELACIAQSYTPEQQAQVDALLPKIDLLRGGDNDPALESFSLLVLGSVTGCAAKYSWTEADLQPATLHEFGRLLELGIRRHGAFTPDQVRRIDTALDTGDRTQLWRALEEQFNLGFEGAEVTVSDDNAAVLGAFIVEVGLGTDEAVAEKVGAYLAAKVMQRASARQFAQAE